MPITGHGNRLNKQSRKNLFDMLLQHDQINQMHCNEIAINAPPQKDHPVFLHRARSQGPEHMVVHFLQIDEAPSGKVPPERTRN